MTDVPPRRPRAFDVDDPRVAPGPVEVGLPPADDRAVHGPRMARPDQQPPAPDPGRLKPTTTEGTDEAAPSWRPMAALEHGFGWGGVLLGAVGGLVLLAGVAWLTTTVGALLAREDWIGWATLGLAAIALLAGLMLILGEVIGFIRLRHLGTLRREANALTASPDVEREQRLVRRLLALSARNPRQAWAVGSFRAHLGDVHDAGAYLTLADRDLMQPLDMAARGLILGSARRVATVTAVSPIAAASVLFVLYENLALMRRLAALYGGRPQLLGCMALARRVIATLITSGGIALTDDLLGQFLGQDLLRRLSRRLAEGAINGALTARLGAATVDVVRPIPFLEAPPVRARDILGELLKRQTQA